jgi:hypothetical protein
VVGHVYVCLSIDFASTLFQLDFVNSLTVLSRFLVKQHEVKYGQFVVFAGILYGKKTK